MCFLETIFGTMKKISDNFSCKTDIWLYLSWLVLLLAFISSVFHLILVKLIIVFLCVFIKQVKVLPWGFLLWSHFVCKCGLFNSHIINWLTARENNKTNKLTKRWESSPRDRIPEFCAWVLFISMFSHDNLKKWLKIFHLHSETSGFVISSQNWNKEFSAPLSVCVFCWYIRFLALKL